MRSALALAFAIGLTLTSCAGCPPQRGRMVAIEAVR